MTIPRTLEEQVAELYRRDAERSRRDRNRRRSGTVKEGPDEQGRYRVLLSAQGGKDFLSGWIKPRVPAGAMVKIDVILKQGEQVDVVSESGDMTDARIEMSDYSDTNPRENSNTPLHIVVDGDAVIIAGKLKIEADVEITGQLDINGGGVTNNGVNIGHDHKHQDVMPGSGITGDPVG